MCFQPVVRVRFHHEFSPPSSFGDVLVQLHSRRARPQHTGASRVHVGQVVEGQNVAGLKKSKTNLNEPFIVLILNRFRKLLVFVVIC